MKTDKVVLIAMMKEKKKYYEACAEVLGAEINRLSTESYKEFIEDNIQEIRISSIYNGRVIFSDNRERIIRPDVVYRPAIKNEPKFFAWLLSEKCGGIIKSQVHPKTLEAFVTNRKEQNLALPDNSILSVFDQQTVKITLAQAPKTSKGETK